MLIPNPIPIPRGLSVSDNDPSTMWWDVFERGLDAGDVRLFTFFAFGEARSRYPSEPTSRAATDAKRAWPSRHP